MRFITHPKQPKQSLRIFIFINVYVEVTVSFVPLHFVDRYNPLWYLAHFVVHFSGAVDMQIY